MVVVFRVSPGVPKGDLTDRFGSILVGLEERVAKSLFNFEQVWKNTSKHKSRYSDGSHPVLYTACSEKVAIVEKGYWVENLILKPMKASVCLTDYCIYKLKVTGTFLKFSISDDVRIVHPTDYAYCNSLGQQAVRSGHAYLVVPSARVGSGFCVPVFCKDSSKVDEENVNTLTYTWNASTSKLSAYWNGTSVSVVSEDVYSTVSEM
jgi:hypothetical protein